MRAVLGVTLAVILAACGGRGSDGELLRGATMGTSWSARVIGLPPDQATELVQEQLDLVEGWMSTWDKTTELSRFNASRPHIPEWFAVSAATAEVVERALHWFQESGGAFDVTIGPLVERWGFGPEGRRPTPPSDEELSALQKIIGAEHLECTTDPPALRKLLPALQVDLSAIAKGYAVDRAAQALRQAGAQAAMVEVGGEVHCFGVKQDGQPWSIGIEAPDPTARRVDRVIPLENVALASSGDYRNAVEVDGRRLSHIFDPRAGRPLPHALASVSVLANSCLDADAMATLIMVLGPDDGFQWATERGVAARFLVHDEAGGWTVHATAAFERLFGVEP